MKPNSDRLIEVFTEARARGSAGERERFLAEVFAQEPELRGAIESLLQADASAGDFLPTTTGGPVVAIEQQGERIGRYKLLQKLGEGGMGTVWMADQEEPVRRRVALKIVKLGMDTRDIIARFEAERQALALMDHPNIARVFDAGATDTGRPYFVMELVPGIRLTDYCDQNNLSTRERLELFTKVCQAVQHAHQKGIIHRDLKPSNILVTLHDGVPVPKVIDFGIAKATAQRLTDKTLFTELGAILGTPAYMSPEQTELSGLDIDTRSDVYSLGVLLYQLLTGRPPFDPKELMAAGLEQMCRTIREKEPPRPSTRLTTLGKEDLATLAKRHGTDAPKLVNVLRGDLDWIVMKCLEKDRRRRYDTANGLAADIQRHLGNEPVVARPPSATYRFRKLVRRNKLAFAAGAAVLAALIVGLGVSLWQTFEKSRALRRAVAAEHKSSEVARFLRQMLDGVGPAVALGRDTALLREILDKTAERVGRDLTGQPEVEGDLRNTLGEVYRALGQDDKAEAMHRQSLAIARRVYGENDQHTADSLNNLALSILHQGRFAEAESLLRQTLDLHRRLVGNDHEEVAGALHNLAAVLRERGNLAESEARQREALDLIRKLHGDESEHVAMAQQNLAKILQIRGQLEESERWARAALALLRRVHGAEHPLVGSALSSLSFVLREQKKLEEAEATSREALAQARKLLGREHVHIAQALQELAEVLRRQNKLGEAEEAGQEALAMLEKLVGREHRFTAFVLGSLSEILADQGRLDEAAALQREALATRRKLFGDEHPDVVRSLNILAGILRKQSRLAEAEVLLREAIRVTSKLSNADDPILISPLKNLARTLEDQGRLAECEALDRRALEIERKVHGKDSLEAAAHLESLGRVLGLQRKFAEAEPMYREAIAIRQGRLPPGHFDVFTVNAGLGRLLADWALEERRPELLERAREAERLLRQSLDISEGIPNSNPAMVGDMRSRLGSAVAAVAVTDPALDAATRQSQMAEAGQLLLAGHEQMQRTRGMPAMYPRASLERMIRFQTAWNTIDPAGGHAAQAAEWRQKLSDFDQAAANARRPAPAP